MKAKLFILTLFLSISVTVQSQVFQEHFQVPGNYFHEVCTDQMHSSSQDIIVAGNFYDASFSYPMIELLRLDELSGNLVWQHHYYDPTDTYEKVRIFDVLAYSSGDEDMVVLTGSLTINDINYLFIIKVDESGNYISGIYYKDLVLGATHTQGLDIIYSQGGFVVSGFTNMDYNHSTGDATTGFVMMVDLNLNPIWTKNISTSHANATFDYDMVSDVTETSDGFFITGSVTSVPSSTLQAVLCLKLDFSGNVIWTSSYLYGNSRDVGVDAYYDANTNEIFLLTNYSASHYFGVTVLDNSTGAIDVSKSFVAYDWDNLNRYGFTIMESVDANNLVIAGYIRDGYYDDPYNNSIYSQTIPFVYEFEKTTGDQMGVNYFYNIPFTDPGFSDYFDFWNAQMPLIYYPDMALNLSNGSGYFLAGYRSDSLTGFTEIEMINTDITHRTHCYQTPLELNHDPIQTTNETTDVTDGNPTHFEFALAQTNYDYLIDSSCMMDTPPPPCLCETLPAHVAAGFSCNITDLTVVFQPNALLECDSVEWIFGDNTTAFTQGNQSVSHTYPYHEYFNVCMKVTRYADDGTVCTDSICKQLDLLNVGVIQNEKSRLNIYPNPAINIVHFDIPQITEESYLIISDIYGRIIKQLKVFPQQSEVLWECQDQDAGVYFYKSRLEGKNYRGKLIVK